MFAKDTEILGAARTIEARPGGALDSGDAGGVVRGPAVTLE